MENLRILFAASEVVPFAKTGGLGDVAGSLPKELKKLGQDARIVMPKYGSIPEELLRIYPLENPKPNSLVNLNPRLARIGICFS